MKNTKICHSWRGKNLVFIPWRSIISILLLGCTLVDGLQTKNIRINELKASGGKSDDEQAGKGATSRVDITKAPSIRSENRQHNKNIDDGGPKSGVQLDVQEHHVVMDNGLVQVNLSNPDGLVTAVRFNGVEDNLLEVRDAEDSRGFSIMVMDEYEREAGPVAYKWWQSQLNHVPGIHGSVSCRCHVSQVLDEMSSRED